MSYVCLRYVLLGKAPQRAPGPGKAASPNLDPGPQRKSLFDSMSNHMAKSVN